jgi:hypothetical protein
VEDGPDRLPDGYFSQDYPVLLEIARAKLDASAQALPPRPERLAELLGRPLVEACASASRLRQAGYIRGDPINTGVKDYLIVTGITTLGLREVGADLKPSDVAARLQRFLEAEASEAERIDPERGQKIRQTARALVDVGTTFAAKFAAEMARLG